MLVEPEEDAVRRDLDRALAAAVRARLAAGPRPSPDADAIGWRDALSGLSAAEREAARAVLGRLDAASGAPLTVWGGTAQLLAADRFGLSARPVAEPEQALDAARKGGRALMELAPGKAWWGRLLAEPALRIVAALPDDRLSHPRALMVMRTPPGPTGDDRTFWATDSRLPDARIVEALSARGLAATSLTSAGGLKLFVLAGYVQAEDGRLHGAPGDLSGVIGAAPIY